jgi:S-adenosylmethionine-dependent methyltransferase
MYEKYILQDQIALQVIEEALLKTYFAEYDQEFLQSEQGRQDIKANVSARYNNSLKHVVPWVLDVVDLDNKEIVEIGCGTGSSTAAFAHFAKKIHGYDISKSCIEAAEKRCRLLNLSNVNFELVTPDLLISQLENKHPHGVDVFLLFAVLEHQTVYERQDTLRACWRLLKDDGIIVVVETPNLLQYTDHHTSLLPFLHMLPSELYAQYAKYSPRLRFNQVFENTTLNHSEISEVITRWGRGISYHDFEIALGRDYKKYIVRQGFEPEILSWFNVSFEEELLRLYVQSKNLDIPLGFTRSVINLILKKNNVSHAPGARIPDHVFFVQKADLLNCQTQLKSLNALYEDCNKTLQEIVSSKSWRIGRFITAPYRKMKMIVSKLCG